MSTQNVITENTSIGNAYIICAKYIKIILDKNLGCILKKCTTYDVIISITIHE